MAFTMGCFFLATYYGITQAVRFIENKDSSTISQKIFNHAPNNKYPTFTICIKGKNIYSSNEMVLFEQTELTSLQYVDLLEGNSGYRYKYDEKDRTYEKESVNLSCIFNRNNFSILSPRQSDIIVGTHFIAQNDFHSTHNSQVPCYAGDLSDDTRIRQESIRKVGCVPIYWKDLDDNSNDELICESRESLAKLKTMISSFSGISDGRSCISMDTLVIQSKAVRQDDKHITIKVSYLGNTYQETENIQDFTFETFFSSLGGFIGIFLGYSMLQAPELLSYVPLWAKKLKKSSGKIILVKEASLCMDIFTYFHF